MPLFEFCQLAFIGAHFVSVLVTWDKYSFRTRERIIRELVGVLVDKREIEVLS